MCVPLIRPKVADLILRLYDRPLHPEFFDVLATQVASRHGYTLAARITRSGHVLSWSNGRVRLEEVTATADMELPAAGVRMSHDFRVNRNARHDAGNIRYRVSSQLEILPPEQFIHLHEELARDGKKKGLVYHGTTGSRLGPPPLGVLILQAVSAGLSATAFHTFPDELAIIKTQSLIEWGP